MWWWNTYGWWWWWGAFVLVFFVVPLVYGWAYRGWGPWYRRRRTVVSGGMEDSGWGIASAFLWLVLVLAIIWLVTAWGWGTW